ncbi:YdeI/OmpD-associated family protein [Tsuneonella rigui]|uniref:YdeI/OmpD-associated family protein n=1 Tax=Tsuneonella rigui TaxID=1708790 RepID=UPI000F7D7278|nr:YdeI/OmpD-associated family protein [Tsuneonella rigui]
MNTDPRIDAYIAKAAPFAQPILQHIRAVIREALPEAAETVKWSVPHWTHAGKNVAGMAAFKAHCAMMIHGEGRQGEGEQKEGMGGFGKIKSIDELPPRDELVAKLRSAAQRVETVGSATPKVKKPPKAEIAMPDDFAAALAGNAKAKAALEGFAPSHRREYLEWITEAKREETRAKRIAQAVEWLAEGKKRNWKYENC